jgi:hypothetical protein
MRRHRRRGWLQTCVWRSLNLLRQRRAWLLDNDRRAGRRIDLRNGPVARRGNVVIRRLILIAENLPKEARLWLGLRYKSRRRQRRRRQCRRRHRCRRQCGAAKIGRLHDRASCQHRRVIDGQRVSGSLAGNVGLQACVGRGIHRITAGERRIACRVGRVTGGIGRDRGAGQHRGPERRYRRLRSIANRIRSYWSRLLTKQPIETPGVGGCGG